jgi:hypothetical protein
MDHGQCFEFRARLADIGEKISEAIEQMEKLPTIFSCCTF